MDSFSRDPAGGWGWGEGASGDLGKVGVDFYFPFERGRAIYHVSYSPTTGEINQSDHDVIISVYLLYIHRMGEEQFLDRYQ